MQDTAKDQPSAHKSTSNLIDRTALKSIEAALKAAPIPEQKMTTGQALKMLMPELKRQLDRGHTVDTITTTLTAAGMHVSRRTLGKLLRAEKVGPRAARGPLTGVLKRPGEAPERFNYAGDRTS